MMMSTAPANILVRAPNWIGDAVMSTSFLAALPAQESGARVTVLAHQRAAPVFLHHPGVGRVITIGAKDPLWKTALGIRRERFDRAYILPLSLSSALIAWAAGIPERAGYDADCRGPLLTRRLRYDKAGFRSRHLVEDYAALADAHGQTKPPEVFLAGEEMRWAGEWLKGRGFTDAGTVGFGPGAAYGPAKRWPMERWIELGRRLKQQGRRVLIFGSFEESRLCKEIERNIGTTAVSLAGGTDLRQSAALIAQCRAFVTNDSGVMHLAAAVGTRVTALFGSTNPAWTGPWGGRHAVLTTKEPCSPCYARTCRYGHYNCLNKITVEDVWNAAVPS
jgi:heptosyltransferase II